jgi:predicted solute-binding protein
MKNNKYICYTGIGSRNTGNHTKEQYLSVMKKHFKKDCAVNIKSLKCKSCKKSRDMNTKIVKKSIKAQMKKKSYKMSKKTEKKLLKQMEKCNKCKNNKTKKCNFIKYIKFSGAELGKCNKE